MMTYLYNNAGKVCVRDLDDLISVDEHNPFYEPMKRITRDRRLTPEEAEHNEAIREQVAQELPDLIARHHRDEERAKNKAECFVQREYGFRETPFVWYDHHYDAHALPDMQTAYLFYALRMVWNHSVPAYLRVGKNLNYYPDVPNWHPAYRRTALFELTSEFIKRAPYESEIRDEFTQMLHRSLLIQRLGL